MFSAITLTSTFCLLTALGAQEAAAQPEAGSWQRKETHVYKTVGGLELKLDAHLPRSGKCFPAVMWIHGGALVMGNRVEMDYGFASRAMTAGCAVVSIDYRLAPETKAPGIVNDVRDAYGWLCANGPELLNIDPERIAVAGASAGGYLTLMAGLVCEPRPKALVALYGYGDIAGAWLTEPYAHYRTIFPLLSEEEARASVGKAPVAAGGLTDRGKFYLYCRQQGLWPELVFGAKPSENPGLFAALSPAKRVTAYYPPTVLVHGIVDHDVPFEQSKQMAQEFEKCGVEHELIALENADHGFAGGAKEEIDAALDRAVAFMIEQLDTD